MKRLVAQLLVLLALTGLAHVEGGGDTAACGGYPRSAGDAAVPGAHLRGKHGAADGATARYDTPMGLFSIALERDGRTYGYAPDGGA